MKSWKKDHFSQLGDENTRTSRRSGSSSIPTLGISTKSGLETRKDGSRGRKGLTLQAHQSPSRDCQ